MSENPLMSLFRQSEKDRRPYSQTLEKGMLWPVVKSGYTGKPEWSTEGGLIGSAIDAFTLPGRVMKGEVAPDDPGEMVNFVGNVLGGGMAANMRRGVNPGVASMSGAQPPKQQGIRAYHGSPHDFDRFDMSKIGTGEGAQAYGHGLYFAENEGVARSYRNQLSDVKFVADATGTDARIDNPAELAGFWVASQGSNARKTALSHLAQAQRDEQYYLKANAPVPQRMAKQRVQTFREALKHIDDKSFAPVKKEYEGRMYEVNIKADPADFLDWDKPLSQQSEKAQQAVRSYMGLNRGAKADEIGWKNIADRPIADAIGGVLREDTKALREAGIPGIRYLDQGSRAAGQGSSNYVVFDDSIISILRKYGLLGMLGGANAFSDDDASARAPSTTYPASYPPAIR